MIHPLTQIKPARRTHYFYPLLGLTLLLLLVMNFVGLPLNPLHHPRHRLLPFAATPPTPTQMLQLLVIRRARPRRLYPRGSTSSSPLPIPPRSDWPVSWPLPSSSAAARPSPVLGAPLAWGLWIAALLDFVENFALVILLFGWVQSPWPQIAAVCAAIKFALLLLA